MDEPPRASWSARALPGEGPGRSVARKPRRSHRFDTLTVTARMLPAVALAALSACQGDVSLPSDMPAVPRASVAGGFPTPSPEYSSPFDVEVGECFDGIFGRTGDEELLAARILACNDPHQFEAFGVGEMDVQPDAGWPGTPAVDRLAESVCRPAFKAYVGVDWDASVLVPTYFGPLADTWAIDHGVLCVVEAHPAAPLIDSVSGSKS